MVHLNNLKLEKTNKRWSLCFYSKTKIMELNIRQKLFVDEYITNNFNATNAYLSVFDTDNPKTAQANSSELLRRQEVKDYLDFKMKELVDRHNISKDMILEKVLKIMNDENARNADKLKGAEIILRAMGYNEPNKTEISGGLENKLVQVKYKKEED